MANSEHIAILAKGVEEWNKWRHIEYDGHPGTLLGQVKPDLRGWDGSFLREFDFRRFVQEYFPAPSEMGEMYDAYATGTLTADLKGYGWRNLNDANLSGTDLSESDLSGIHLRQTNLRLASLSNANLASANLSGAYLNGADLTGACLISADLSKADLSEAVLTGATLTSANLSETNLTGAVFRGADLTRARLERAVLVETVLDGADLSSCQIYGLSAWNVSLKEAVQIDLVVTRHFERPVTVDYLEVAQFVYLLLQNERIRQVVDTITSKVVLILGRFTEERKSVLDALREALRQRNYLPILFDFEGPTSRDLTETISTLAHMARFVVADITDARSIPQELQSIVPDLPSVPVQPILLASQREYAMFEHFRRYSWVLQEYLYNDTPELLRNLHAKVIAPAEAKLLETSRSGV